MIKMDIYEIFSALFYLIQHIVKYLILRKVENKQIACFGFFILKKALLNGEQNESVSPS